MQYDDDIAFQRAILANPADTTLKLVYADWLHDRADPRANYIRLKLQLDDGVRPYYLDPQPHLEPLRELGRSLDAGWVGFMETLAQPFEPSAFQEGNPFIEPIGERGKVSVFRSQYRNPESLNDGLFKDLAFLARSEWGVCWYGYEEVPLDGFLCDLRTNRDLPSRAEVRAALKVAVLRPDGTLRNETSRFETGFDDQFLFSHEPEDGGEMARAHGRLKRYVSNGHLWYLTLPLEATSSEDVTRYEVGFAVGCSPHGNRLLGVLACQTAGPR